MKFLYIKTTALCFVLLLPFLAMSQGTGVNSNGTTTSAPPTAVPFLNISPNSRSGAMGEAGVAISPDVNDNYWNPSKLAFLESNDAVSASYSPWLRNLVPDISLSYISYAHKIDERSTIGASLRYFNYGSLQATDGQQNSLGTFTPSEYSINVSYARKFGENFSLGLSGGYVYSGLSNATFSAGTSQAKSGRAVDAGVSLYYTKKTQEFGSDAVFSFGTNISNIGSKVNYGSSQPSYFLPANLKLGFANTINADDFNQFTFALDFNKLLVPYATIQDANGNYVKGADPTVSVPAGIFGSFSNSANGELKTISISPGIEYWYNQLFAIRAGYFYQNPSVGGTHYLTAGVGFKYDGYAFDFSYLAAAQQNSPLANTLRFTLIATFGGDTNVHKK